MTFLRRNLLGMLLGAGTGLLYWKFFGCDGSCLITSSPYRSMLYFALLGYLLTGVVLSGKKPKQPQSPEA